MPISVARVAKRHLRAAAEAPSKGGVAVPGQFVDVMAFAFAVNAYRELKGDDALVTRAETLASRVQDDLVDGITSFFLPLVDDPGFTRFKSPIHMAMRRSRGVEQLSVQAEVLRSMMQVLRTRPTLLQDALADGKAFNVARQIANVVANDAPESILRGLALLPRGSRLQTIRTWIHDAASAANVAPSETETLLVDAGDARELGEALRGIDAQIANTDPVSQDAANLQDKRQDLLSEISAVAERSSNPTVVLTSAVATDPPPLGYATQTAKAVRLSPDQEKAMMVRGKAVIAAGAGSGKTATLAAKVAYHINELGVPPGAVIATSFSRKSAAELLRRINKYGADIPQTAMTGYGTTHSIAGKLMQEYGGGGRDAIKGHEHANLVRLAMEQVRMLPKGGHVVPPPPPTGLFQGVFQAPQAALTFLQALELARKRGTRLNPYLRRFIDSFFDPRDQWYQPTMRMTQNLRDPRGLAEKQRQIVKEIFEKTDVSYSPNTDPNLVPSATPKTAGASRKPAADKDKGLREKYISFTQPANQWFNLGDELVEEDLGGEKKPIPIGTFKQAISKLKGRALSPSEAWHQSERESLDALCAAVYAAYEYLKGADGEIEFRGRGDFDDIILDTSKMMLSNPRILQQVQSRFKVVLVDEAQDQNRAQHLMFGLISGFVDPAKAEHVGTAQKISEVSRDDGKMSADTYVFIGDDKQCVERDAIVSTRHGTCKVGDLRPNDEILAYRNGKVAFQTVRHVVPSSWERGLKVTTRSGLSLTMSPNHKLWASEPRTEEGQLAVYLMYRKDMGFRVGVTNKGKVGSEDDYLASYGGRAFMEKAERLWIIDIVNDREEALLREQDISLTYGIPMTVFGGEGRGLNQERIDAIFKKHGHNGAQLLEARHLSFDLPHWMSQSYTKHGRERHTIQFNAHGNQGSNVSLEWEGPKFDEVLVGFKISVVGERRRLRRWFNNYREGLAFAEDLARRTGANLSCRLSTPDGILRKTTASGLFVGMSLPVLDAEHNTVVHDEIVSIDEVGGSFIDLDVDDASTFFANNILTSNSIYEFRGADPEAFIDMSDLVAGGAGFKTQVLKTNYRSGKQIVEAANRLIAHNSRQIPMTCEANPKRVDPGEIKVVPFPPITGRALSGPATWLAEQIADDMAEGRAESKGYDAFGVGLRSNAEAYAYGIELLKKGIPFRSKANFFNDPSTKAILCWLTLADEGPNGNVDRINAAVLGARSIPASKLGPTFEEKLKQLAKGNYLTWLEGNASAIYGRSGAWADLVQQYVANLQAVANMENTSSELLLDAILALTGFDGRTVNETLIDKIRDDDERLAELRAESPDGNVSEEAVKEMAHAPLAPLRGLLESRSDLTEAMKYVRQLQDANAKLATEDDPDAKGFREPAVTLGTMHSWKGLEVDRMFLPLVGGRFPRTSATEEELASERRLAYVAVTRGESHVTIMNIPTVRSTKMGPIVIESQFIGEMCLPQQSKSVPEDVSEDVSEGVSKVGSSPQDEAEMDAYLKGRGL